MVTDPAVAQQMMAGRTRTVLVQEWDDGRRSSIEWEGDNVTPERLAVALTGSLPAFDPDANNPGDGHVLRRHRLGPLEMVTGKEVGPPPWRVPRPIFYVRRGAVVVGFGWRMTAHRLSISAARP